MNISPKYKKFIILLVITLSAEYIVAKLIYNQLVDEAHILHIAHGRLETALQQRKDTVDNVIKAANGYVQIEEMVFNRLAELNGLIEDGAAKALQDEKMSEIVILVNGMKFLAEDYPALQSKGPYLLMMETIQEAGKIVTEERMRYNEATYEYNMYCKLFPYNIFARVLGFHDEPLFEAEEGAEIVPEIRSL